MCKIRPVVSERITLSALGITASSSIGVALGKMEDDTHVGEQNRRATGLERWHIDLMIIDHEVNTSRGNLCCQRIFVLELLSGWYLNFPRHH